jgi:hypothetical protein
MRKELGIHIKNVQRNIRIYKNDYIYNKGSSSSSSREKRQCNCLGIIAQRVANYRNAGRLFIMPPNGIRYE